MQSTCKEGDKQALWFCGNKSSKSVKQDSDNIILKSFPHPFRPSFPGLTTLHRLPWHFLCVLGWT